MLNMYMNAALRTVFWAIIIKHNILRWRLTLSLSDTCVTLVCIKSIIRRVFLTRKSLGRQFILPGGVSACQAASQLLIIGQSNYRVEETL